MKLPPSLVTVTPTPNVKPKRRAGPGFGASVEIQNYGDPVIANCFASGGSGCGPAVRRCWINRGGFMGDKSPKKPNAKKPAKSLKEKRAEKQLKGQSNKRLGGL